LTEINIKHNEDAARHQGPEQNIVGLATFQCASCA